VALLALRHLVGAPDADHLPTGVTTLGSQVDDPICRTDHLEVVLDHDQRMPLAQELSKGLEERGDIIEVQARSRLIEKKQGTNPTASPAASFSEISGEG
jgi:hypothetical protein